MKITEQLNKFESTLTGKILITIIPTIITYVGLIEIKGTVIETFILTHKILIATIFIMILIISFLAIYEIFKRILIEKTDSLSKALAQVLTIHKIEKNDRELSDKILKNQIDYNRECLDNHILGKPIKPYNPVYTKEMKKLHEELNKERIQNSL